MDYAGAIYWCNKNIDSYVKIKVNTLSFKHFRSHPPPTNLEPGEIAVNNNSQNPFLAIKDSSGAIRQISENAKSLASSISPTDILDDLNEIPHIANGGLRYYPIKTSATANQPTKYAYILQGHYLSEDNYDFQLAVDMSLDAGLYTRYCNGGTWGLWKQYINTDNGIKLISELGFAKTSDISEKYLPLSKEVTKTSIDCGEF